jgi:hypothetical protein
VREKAEQTMLEHHGVKFSRQSPTLQTKAIETITRNYGVANPGQHPAIRAKAVVTTLERYGTLTPQNYGAAEEEVAAFLESLGLRITRQYPLPRSNTTLDIYVDDRRIGLEYCGLRWHCEPKRDKRYHRLKMDIAEEENIRLITMFEDEWLHHRKQTEGVLAAIMHAPMPTLGARLCSVRPLAEEEAEHFIAANHILGAHPGTKIAWGLFSPADELVGALTLKHDYRPNTADTIVLQRLCFKNGLYINGGAGKLLARAKAWAREHGYATITTWSDNRWSRGTVYAKLGFTCAHENKYDYAYVNVQAPRRRLAKQTQQKKKTDCPPGLTELEWAHQRGLARIWDCGHKRWTLTL